MNVREAAVTLGVSPRRVRALIADGRIRAQRVGRQWEIEQIGSPRVRRPLSARSRSLLARALHYKTLAGLTGQDRARTASRMRELRNAKDPAALLLDWWGDASEPDRYIASLVQRARTGDRQGVRNEIQRKVPAYLSNTGLLAEKVSTERTILGVTPKELAAAADVSVSAVWDIERGLPMRSPRAVRSVLKALNVVPAALPPLQAT